LAEGRADFVAVGRKLLADPDLPNKLADGRAGDVRPCIYQYRCIGNIFVKEPLHCVANAATGREHDLSGLGAPASEARAVLVVATGGVWTRPAVPGADLDHVLTVPQLRVWLDGDDESAVGAHVVVVGGGKTGLSLADLCLRRGRSVAVVEPTNVFGVELGLPG